ncbi:MAG: hypothetical protein JKX96_11250 [Acinetobacter sp.]|nr:hypothetical protein [Acinetobacter sp.]
MTTVLRTTVERLYMCNSILFVAILGQAVLQNNMNAMKSWITKTLKTVKTLRDSIYSASFPLPGNEPEYTDGSVFIRDILKNADGDEKAFIDHIYLALLIFKDYMTTVSRPDIDGYRMFKSVVILPEVCWIRNFKKLVAKIADENYSGNDLRDADTLLTQYAHQNDLFTAHPYNETAASQADTIAATIQAESIAASQAETIATTPENINKSKNANKTKKPRNYTEAECQDMFYKHIVKCKYVKERKYQFHHPQIRIPDRDSILPNLWIMYNVLLNNRFPLPCAEIHAKIIKGKENTLENAFKNLSNHYRQIDTGVGLTRKNLVLLISNTESSLEAATEDARDDLNKRLTKLQEDLVKEDKVAADKVTAYNTYLFNIPAECRYHTPDTFNNLVTEYISAKAALVAETDSDSSTVDSRAEAYHKRAKYLVSSILYQQLSEALTRIGVDVPTITVNPVNAIGKMTGMLTDVPLKLTDVFNSGKIYPLILESQALLKKRDEYPDFYNLDIKELLSEWESQN